MARDRGLKPPAILGLSLRDKGGSDIVGEFINGRQGWRMIYAREYSDAPPGLCALWRGTGGLKPPAILGLSLRDKGGSDIVGEFINGRQGWRMIYAREYSDAPPGLCALRRGTGGLKPPAILGLSLRDKGGSDIVGEFINGRQGWRMIYAREYSDAPPGLCALRRGTGG